MKFNLNKCANIIFITWCLGYSTFFFKLAFLFTENRGWMIFGATILNFFAAAIIFELIKNWRDA